jgi:hypothetical protein
MYTNIVLIGLLAAGAEPAPSGSTAAVSATSPAGPWSALSVDVALESSVGIGTFVADVHADAPYYASTLSLSPAWAVLDTLSVGLDLSATYEWTRWVTPCRPKSGPRTTGAPQEDCSDTDEANGRRWDLGDVGLWLSKDGLYALGGVELSGSTSIGLPLSRASRATGLAFSWGAGLSASRALGPVTLGLGLRWRKMFPLRAANALDAADVEDARIPITRCASFRRTDCVLLTGFVASWRGAADLSARVRIVDGLSAGASIGYAYTRSFGTGGDARSAVRTDVDGRVVVDGVNEFDSTSGSVDVRWAPRDDLALSLGLASVQPARTADGKALRFPFWDLVSPANNFSALYLEVRYSR